MEWVEKWGGRKEIGKGGRRELLTQRNHTSNLITHVGHVGHIHVHVQITWLWAYHAANPSGHLML